MVHSLLDTKPYRKYRAPILVTVFCSLRWGEVTALRRCDVAPDGSWVRVSSQFIELIGRGLVRTPPKSRAGARTVTVPAAIRPDVVAHLRDFVAPASDAGHDSPRAAMVYQHATTVEDRAIADRLSLLVDAHRGESEDTHGPDDPGDDDDDGDDGAAGVLVSVS